ncbi:hypothetical protein SMD22_01950 (plasmid) [Brevibacillus halotolerans]|nr:hypothetical protein SMD22_01950 [Brevibacillus halotolerans]
MKTLNNFDDRKHDRPFHKISLNGILYGKGRIISLHNPKEIHELQVGLKRGIYDNSDFAGISIDIKV